MRAKFWCIVELGQPKHRKIDVLPFLGGNDIERKECTGIYIDDKDERIRTKKKQQKRDGLIYYKNF
jgi:hypothetical protein